MDYKGILTAYKNVPGGMIEAFHAIQKDFSYLPEEAVIEAADLFNVSTSEAYGVATFYSMFSIKARGQNIIRICESAPCHIVGAAEVVSALEAELGIKMGETTADGSFTLEFTECVGQCQSTPVITINGQPYVDICADAIPTVLSAYK